MTMGDTESRRQQAGKTPVAVTPYIKQLGRLEIAGTLV
jgi:hypothetical protein